MLTNSKLPISAIVVSCNEAYIMENCLQSIQFCNEIIVVDMACTDNSVEIAKKYTNLIVYHEKTDMVEYLFPELIPSTKNEWVMLIDPDERIDVLLAEDLRKFFNSIPLDCGKINVPIIYYYKNKPLKGTVWGGDKSGRLLIRKSGCIIGSNVHTAITLKPGFQTYRIKRSGQNVDHHFWVQSYEQMMDKHKRYTQKEGKSKYDKGERYTIFRHFRATLNAFLESFWKCKGYKDGFLGLFLSAFYAWYISASWRSLSMYQKGKSNG